MKGIPQAMNNDESLPIFQEILARVIAIENSLQSKPPSNSEAQSVEKFLEINWTASKTDLIELIYGLYANRAFNNGKTSIRAITLFFESALDMKLGNTSLRFQEILRRKDSLAFLDQVRESLESYISRIDERH
ncbi:MAG: RteC domain-containing protein [Bacteroidota bacterium]